jgi:secondary thiamine-phosphate synthase enzyme
MTKETNMLHTLKVRSHEREELVEFTEQVQKQLSASNQKKGVVVLHVQHTTAGLTVNENADPDVPRDMLHLLRTLIPQHGMGFRHGEENSDAHIKATLVGSSVTVPFRDGKLLLGRWQGIFLCEFDGGRERQVIISALQRRLIICWFGVRIPAGAPTSFPIFDCRLLIVDFRFALREPHTSNPRWREDGAIL